MDLISFIQHLLEEARVNLSIQLYWIIIIGSMVGTYYYLQPFIKPLMDTYDTLIGLPDAVKNIDISSSLGF